ncbi:MAG: inner membrane protein YpjD [Terriglobia bacterium]
MDGLEAFSLLFLGLTFLIYFNAFFVYLYAFLSKQESIGKAANYALLAGFATHTASIAFRWAASGHLPGFSAYESFSVVAWFITGGYLVVEYRVKKLKVLGLFSTLVVALFLVQAATKYSEPGPPIPILKSPLISVHFSLMYVMAAALTVAGGSALLYLVAERQMKGRKSFAWLRRLPALEVLDEVTYQAILFGFPFLTLVMLTGTVRALQVYVVAQDPVVLSRLVATSLVWVIYIVYLVLRMAAGWGGRKAAVLALSGFLGILVIRFVVVQYISHIV